MLNSFGVHAEKQLWHGGIRLLLYRKMEGGKIYVASDIQFKELQEGFTPENDGPLLSYEAGQCLMDELWNCGLRPSEGTGSAGALKATEEHLKDLRQILWHKLGMNR